MEKNFVITAINHAILVKKNQYPQKESSFGSVLKSNELIFQFSGKSKVFFGGKVLEVEANTIRFLPKGNCGEYVVKREESGECIDILFDTDVPLCAEAFVMKHANSTKIGAMFKKLLSVWVARNDGYYFECMSLLYKILSEMQKTNYISQNQYDTIKPAIEHIEANFLCSKISMAHLAEKCGISEVYLKKLFIKKFGVPPKKYIIQLKINHACDLLSSGIYSITEVSGLCGYDNVYYFSRQFKEYVGTSPSEYNVLKRK